MIVQARCFRLHFYYPTFLFQLLILLSHHSLLVPGHYPRLLTGQSLNGSNLQQEEERVSGFGSQYSSTVGRRLEINPGRLMIWTWPAWENEPQSSVPGLGVINDINSLKGQLFWALLLTGLEQRDSAGAGVSFLSRVTQPCLMNVGTRGFPQSCRNGWSLQRGLRMEA